MGPTPHGADGVTEGYVGGTIQLAPCWWLSLSSHPFSRRRVSEVEGVPQPGQALPVKAGHDAQNGRQNHCGSSALDPRVGAGATCSHKET